MALTIPSKPSGFNPKTPPPGYRTALVNMNNLRPRITPRLQLVHTNGASTQGSIESSLRWANAGGDNTIPHFQVDRDGDAAMLLELDRKGIAGYRADMFCINYETADRGYKTDPYPKGSEFTEAQQQMIAVGLAYCSVLWHIPLSFPVAWDGTGSATHTEPFSYPYWTKYQGKACPGDTKKRQFKEIIVPHARRILTAWSNVTPPPTSGNTYTVQSGDSWWKISQQYGISVDELVALNPPKTSSTVIHPGDILNVPGSTAPAPGTLVMKYGGTSTANWAGWFSRDNRKSRQPVTDMAGAHHLVLNENGGQGSFDAKDLHKITDLNWSDVSWTNSIDELNRLLGPG